MISDFRPIEHFRNCNGKSKKRWLHPTHTALIISHVLVAAHFLLLSGSLGRTSGVHLVDLTHVFDNTTIYWVTEPSLTLNITHKGLAPGGNWYQKDQLFAATHGGTHLDAPCHFYEDRWCITDIPLQHLVAPAVVVDISSEVDGNADVHLTTAHLLDWERQHGPIPDGSVLLINTGWSKHWPDRLKYTGTTTKDPDLLKFPSIKGETAEWLVSNRKVVGVGLDTMSVDVPGVHPKTHVTLAEHNIYGLENVDNLHLLPPTGAMVYALPMKLKSASGAPCRLVAQLPESPRREL